VHELVPVALGAMVAVVCRHISAGPKRAIAFAMLIPLAAALAAFVNGELRGWPFFIAADICFALAGAVAGRLCLSLSSRIRLARRSWQSQRHGEY
jgi:hypothetical protein